MTLRELERTIADMKSKGATPEQVAEEITRIYNLKKAKNGIVERRIAINFNRHILTKNM